MKSPCIKCDWHLSGGSKSGPRCTNCAERLEYLGLPPTSGMVIIRHVPPPKPKPVIPRKKRTIPTEAVIAEARRLRGAPHFMKFHDIAARLGISRGSAYNHAHDVPCRENRGKAPITPEQAAAVIDMRRRGKKHKEIIQALGIGKSTIGKILTQARKKGVQI